MSISIWRLASFLTALVAIWLAAGSPLAGLDHQLLSAHMMQHLLLMAAAAPLVLVGSPVRILLLVCSFFPRVHLTRMRSLSSRLVLCWFVGTVTVLAWHIPALFAQALHVHWLHGVEQVSFLVAGFFFWWPVVQHWSSTEDEKRWSIPLYLFLATLPCDALSAYFVFCDHVVYPHYLSTTNALGISALQDQEWAGTLMWVSITFIYVVPAAAIIYRLLLRDSALARISDAE